MSATVSPPSTLGPIRRTYATAETFPPVARAYTQVSQVVKELGLLQRATGFYAGVGALIAVAFGGCVAGFVLLGNSWLQLLIAAALGNRNYPVCLLAGLALASVIQIVFSGLLGLSLPAGFVGAL